MIRTHFHDHPSAEQLHAFVDGELAPGPARAVEGHVGSCPACASEVEDLRTLFAELEALPRLVPLEGFGERVLQDVRTAPARPLAARIRDKAMALLPSLGHPRSARVQDFVEGLLPEPTAARVATHLDGCPACRREADGWRALLGRLDALGHVEAPAGFAEGVLARRALEARLDALGHLAPSPEFGDRVMAAFAASRAGAAVGARDAVLAPAGGPAPAATPAPAWTRLLAAARRVVPSTRQAWAALSGVAVTPVVTVGLVLWAVFSHPTLTPGALLSFVGWQIADLGALAWNATSGALMQSAGVFRLFTAVEAASGSPSTLLAGFLLFSACTVAALWVLYKNLFATHPQDGRYAHASF